MKDDREISWILKAFHQGVVFDLVLKYFVASHFRLPSHGFMIDPNLSLVVS